jgi:hypothetical protein
MSNCVTWEFRLNKKKLNGSEWEPEQVTRALSKICKSYVYQLEKGETIEQLHYQGTFRLFKRSTKRPLLILLTRAFECAINDAPQYCEPSTSNLNKSFNYDCYATKIQTRVNGPYTDKDNINKVFIPPQFRIEINKLYCYQRKIFEDVTYNDRIISCIVDTKGCTGKSTIANMCEILKGGFVVPPINNGKKLVQVVYKYCVDNNIRKTIDIFIDMPRCMSKDKLYNLYSAIDQIKRGCLYDTRYKFKKWYIDSPRIWIFTNEIPDLNLLSKDMWKIYTLNKELDFIEYVENELK